MNSYTAIHAISVRADSKLKPYQLQLLKANLLRFSIRSVCMAPISLARSGHARLSLNIDYDIASYISLV